MAASNPRTKGYQPKRKNPTEKTIQKEILEWLAEEMYCHWRQNSGWAFSFNKFGKQRMIKLGASGLPDIVVIMPPSGLFVGLEVKSAKGVLRPAQKEFRNASVSVGGKYYVVRTLAEAKEAIFSAKLHQLDQESE